MSAGVWLKRKWDIIYSVTKLRLKGSSILAKSGREGDGGREREREKEIEGEREREGYGVRESEGEIRRVL